MTEDTDLGARVRKTLAQVFGLSADDVAGNLEMGLHPKWDSMGHMELIVAIEKEFGIRFQTYEIAELLSAEKIVNAVERHQQK